MLHQMFVSPAHHPVSRGAPSPVEERVLLVLPTGRDAELAANEIAKAQMVALACRDLSDCVERLAEGCGSVLLAEEALSRRRTGELFAALDRQPSWSVLPLFLLLRADGPLPRSLKVLRAFEKHPKIKATFLQRPVPSLSLISALRSGLRSRLQQYQVRNLLQQLEGDLKRRDEFLAMLGHELRNPVSSIAYAAELFKTAGKELPPETLAWGADLMVRQVRYLSRLLDELLDVARIQSGKIELRTEPLDLRLIVEQSAETFRNAATRRRFTQSLPDEPVIVRGDKVRLTQVVNNLLENAFKYTREGGRIHIALEKDERWASISVIDDGRGVSPDAQAHIFEPFYQDRPSGEVAPPAEGRGLGLGLAMVDQILRLHEGTISVRSAGTGQGSTFQVRLPLAPAALKSEQAPEASVASGQRLLIIEDNLEVADVFAMLLESLGHEAHVAYRGEAGISMAQALRPDMVFIDIGLPDITGQEVARRIQEVLPERAPPLVALTGYPPRKGGEADMFRDYLLKPVSREHIERLLRRSFAA